MNNGYITDISVLPFIRSQQVVARAKGMLFNTPVSTHFDGSNVNNYVRNANIIELENTVIKNSKEKKVLKLEIQRKDSLIDFYDDSLSLLSNQFYHKYPVQ